jgi:hypothetical protein
LLVTESFPKMTPKKYRSKRLAFGKSSTPAAELIREAVAEYVRRRDARAATSIGSARSGRGDLSERAEELLDGFGA